MTETQSTAARPAQRPTQLELQPVAGSRPARGAQPTADRPARVGPGRAAWAWIAVVGLLSGCPAKLEVEGRAFPCRAPADCVEGYECHPTRWVCVPRGSVIDAGLPVPPPPEDAAVVVTKDAEPPAPDAIVAPEDAGEPGKDDAALPDAEAPHRVGLGEACGELALCAEGVCVDGVCCEHECSEVCHRCDQTPGRCLPVPDGTDPDGECTAAYECSDYTFGVVDGVCYAAPPLPVQAGTCSVLGTCRPRGCRNNGPGAELSRCASAECLRPDACPYGARVAQFDEPAELCQGGPEVACTITAGAAGCCSTLGACCAEACTQDSPGMCR